MDHQKKAIDRSRDIRIVHYDALTGEFSDPTLGRVLRTVRGVEKAALAQSLGIVNWEEAPPATLPKAEGFWAKGKAVQQPDGPVKSQPQAAHDCDTADRCESMVAKPAEWRRIGEQWERGPLDCNNPTDFRSSYDTLCDLVSKATDDLIKSEKEREYLQERNAHLREMLALKSDALVKSKADIERLERVVGRIVVEKEGR